jgi:hypothetical protein
LYDQIKKDERGRECSMYVDIEKYIQFSFLESIKRRDHFEDLGINGRTILRQILRKLMARVEWIDLAQDKDHWWSVMNTVLEYWVP